MADRYYRLVTFITDICAVVLRELFVESARKDTTVTYSTLSVYVAARKREINFLKTRKTIRQHQYDLIFPPTGDCDENAWDVTLVCALLQNIFKTETALLKPELTTITGIRNKMQHIKQTACLEETEFQVFWNDLERSTLTIANSLKNADFQTEIKKRIQSLKCASINEILHSVLNWYIRLLQEQNEITEALAHEVSQQTETIDGLKNTIATLEEKLENEVARPLGKLQKATVKRVNRKGIPSKRMKVENEKVNKMKRKFAKAVNRIPSSCIPLPESKSLLDKNTAFVTGNNDCSQQVLFAIRESGQDINRCLFLTSLDQWEDIDIFEDEVDLILLQNPFRWITWTACVSEKFIGILDEIQEEIADGSLKFITVMTNKEADNALEQDFKHGLMSERIILNEAPERTCDAGVDSEDKYVDTIHKRLTEISSIRMTNAENDTYDSTAVKEAKAIIQQKKFVILLGPENTILATITKIAETLGKSSCIFLKDPGHFYQLSLDHVSLLVVEGFAGRLRFQKFHAHKCLQMIDDLEAVMTTKSISVILTSEQKAFQECKNHFGENTWMQNPIMLTTHSNDSDETEGQTSACRSTEACTSNAEVQSQSSPSSATLVSTIDYESLNEWQTLENNDDGFVSSSALFGLAAVNERFLVGFSYNTEVTQQTLMCMDINSQRVTSTLDIGTSSLYYHEIVAVGGNSIAWIDEDSIAIRLVNVNEHGVLKKMKTLDLEFLPRAIAFSGNLLYIVERKLRDVYLYSMDIDGKVYSRLQIPDPIYFEDITVCSERMELYIGHDNMITTLTMNDTNLSELNNMLLYAYGPPFTCDSKGNWFFIDKTRFGDNWSLCYKQHGKNDVKVLQELPNSCRSVNKPFRYITLCELTRTIFMSDYRKIYVLKY